MSSKHVKIYTENYELYSAIYEGLQDVRAGRTHSLDDVMKSLNEDFPDLLSSDDEIIIKY